MATGSAQGKGNRTFSGYVDSPINRPGVPKRWVAPPTTGEAPKSVCSGASRFVPESTQDHDEWATSLWNRMDRDQSGFISREEMDCEELRSIIHSLIVPSRGGELGGATYARAQMNATQALNFCVRKADLNKDHGISFDEFRAFTWCLRHEHMARHTANLIFALFDLNQDNMIDKDEFREIYRFYCGHTPTVEQLNEEWHNLDTRRNQKVSLEEYTRWLQESADPIFRQHAPPKETHGAAALDSQDAYSEQMTAPAGSITTKPEYALNMTLSGTVRPRWNHHLVHANVNFDMPPITRNYFSRAQSLPELKRYYTTRKGFRDHRYRISMPDIKRKSAVCSTEGFTTLPRRHKPGGDMRHPSTGQRTKWEDNWQTPTWAKDRVQPGTITFRCPGDPPRHLFADEYDDYLG